MTYKLFIDDERFPPDDGTEWVICRSFYDLGNILYDKGFPNFISFDHDLGENQKTGYDIVKYLVMLDMDTESGNIPTWTKHKMTFPTDFKFYVHSQNPVGKKNIEEYLTSYLTVKGTTL